jgi:hypothetical protein
MEQQPMRCVSHPASEDSEGGQMTRDFFRRPAIMAPSTNDGGENKKMLTSAMQVTRTPLNSSPSSFSTALLRSAAVSNSTKLPFMKTVSA